MTKLCRIYNNVEVIMYYSDELIEEVRMKNEIGRAHV